MLLNTCSKSKFVGLTALVALLHSSTVLAADMVEASEGQLPAVSGVNGKLDFSYLYSDLDGALGDIHGGAVIGSLSAPIGERYGLQIDAGFSRSDGGGVVGDVDQYGIAAHFFTRDPDKGLLGIYAHYQNTDFGFIDIDNYRYGVEAEWYMHQVSLEGFIGADYVDSGMGDDTFVNLDFTAAYYLNDNVRLEAGVDHQFETTRGKVGFEAILPMFQNNTSVYANASFGEDNTTVRAGLRIYFGEDDKALIDRHRQDDPRTRLLNLNGLCLGDLLDAYYEYHAGCSEAPAYHSVP